ncbi:MAG: hypothetical protein ACI9FJ_002513 [Alteromonadaceae bacterium]|jgi:hypothetical protein
MQGSNTELKDRTNIMTTHTVTLDIPGADDVTLYISCDVEKVKQSFIDTRLCLDSYGTKINTPSTLVSLLAYFFHHALEFKVPGEPTVFRNTRYFGAFTRQRSGVWEAYHLNAGTLRVQYHDPAGTVIDILRHKQRLFDVNQPMV